ncbi:MAG: DUF3536 domain-containing protein [Chloroflexi bacterium]|nr:DUF3536 domain-containing protein [Chloroflexota bacterium]
MTSQFFCVHGHFYQPSREDPLTEEIPLEPGATPYRNWNERIHAQCYRPNAELGNFEHISFDLGPTLIHWMEQADPDTLEKIIQQDRRNLERYGVGNAMAQAYHHTILPLSSRADKVTQVLWGMGDFECRFGHKPQGMWLPETAVDEETLDVLVDYGISYTILAPWQADRPDVDVSQPYWVSLPGGKKITVFFYDQDLSALASFHPEATVNADTFVRQSLLPKFPAPSSGDRLVMIASDGELYGHHQPFRDKFLAYLMDGALKSVPLQATFPALWLKDHTPQEEIKILPNTSWSCHHGVTRWSGSCACTPHPEWKAPLREALNRLAEAIDQQYVEGMSAYPVDPWQLRNAYVRVLCKRTPVAELVREMVSSPLEQTQLRKIEILLAAQYERQRMFASDAWFFDDFDRIEPLNSIAYAAQAVWLTRLATGVDLGPRAVISLKRVKSWRTGLRADRVFLHHLQRADDYRSTLG